MICRNCNNNIPDNSVFCSFCGVAIQNTEPNVHNQAGAPLGNQGNTYIQPMKTYTATQNTSAKKKMKPIAIIGIVLGAIVGVIILLSILVALFSSGSSGSYSYNDSNYEDYNNYDNISDDKIYFERTGEFDDYGREIVRNYDGEDIGYVYDGNVHIYYNETEEIICDEDGYIISVPEGYKPPEYTDVDVEEGGNSESKEQPSDTDEYYQDATTSDIPATDDNTKNAGTNKENNNSQVAQADVQSFVDYLIKEFPDCGISFLRVSNANELSKETFGWFLYSDVWVVGGGYNSEYATYISRDEYDNKIGSNDVSYNAYKITEVERKLKSVWGDKYTVEDCKGADGIITSNGYLLKPNDGLGGANSNYAKVKSFEVSGNRVIVELSIASYCEMDGSVIDGVTHSEKGNIGYNYPAKYDDIVSALGNDSFATTKMYLNITSDGLRLDYME